MAFIILFFNIDYILNNKNRNENKGVSHIPPNEISNKQIINQRQNIVVNDFHLTNGQISLYESGLENVAAKSKNSYITLLSGIDKSLKYRGFLYNTLIMKDSLLKLGSTADFIVLIGFTNEHDEYDSKTNDIYKQDINLLKSHNIIVYVLPRLINFTSSSSPSSSSTNNDITMNKLPPLPRLTFAEMALLKITPYSLIQYEKIQYLDGDVLPVKNMDCFFNINYNTFTGTYL